MKTILFLIPSLGGGGAEKVLVNLVNNLDKTKYDITVQTLFDVGINREFLNQNVRYIGGFKRVFPGNTKIFKLFSPKFLYRFLIKKKYDVVVSYLEGPTARIVSGCTFHESKLVSWIHTLQFNGKNAAYSFRTVKEAEKCYSMYNKVVGVASEVKKDFLTIYPECKNFTEVLYNTNETEQIKQQSQESVEFEVNSMGVKIFSVGRLIPEKGYDRLISVHKQLIDIGVLNEIYILGIGGEEEKLKEKIRTLGVEKTFHLIGFQKNPYKYVAKADLFICSSRREGFSTAVTEALILGVPVVSTCCSGAKELLGKNDEYGIVTENSEEGIFEGLYKMLTTEGLLNHYKKQAQIRGEFFSKENTVKAVEQMFDSLFEEESKV